MTILRKCPEHGEPLELFIGMLRCPSRPDGVPCRTGCCRCCTLHHTLECRYTEPLLPDPEMQQASEARLWGLKAEA